MLNRDFEGFCFTNEEGAAELRAKYKVLFAYSKENGRKLEGMVGDIQELEEILLEEGEGGE